MTAFGSFSDMARRHGLVMCCLCFEGKPVAEMWHDENGSPWDMCSSCKRTESPYTNNLELVNPKSDAHPKGSSTGGLSSPSQAVQSAESNDHLA